MLILKDVDNTVRWREGERLDHLFERRVDQFIAEGRGDHLAVETPEVSLTFKELDERANQLARYLLDQGIGSGDRIGVMFDKTADTYIGLLAILKVNAAYVPFDAGFPNDRIGFILEDAEVKAIVSLARFAEKLSEFTLPLLFIDAIGSELDGKDNSRLSASERPAADDLLAYIIYTSGTTGKPKGVTIEHPSICNFVNVAAEVYGVTENDRSYQGMTVAFDFSVEELWVPLIAGATLIPGKPSTSLVGTDLADYLIENRISYLCIVPTLLATIEKDLPDLKILLVSGEACPHNLVERWHSSERVILNAYGPTEATVTCTLTELYPDKPVTIGGPLPTYTIVILDENEAKEIPNGGTGEVCVAGIGLARDYLKRPDLTAEKFIPDFLDIPNNPSKRIYRTGDLGRINDDDEVEFLGRIDTQVKIRGYRIELTEIESVLMQLPQIAQAVVHTYEPEPGTVELVAYYSLKPGESDVPHKDVSDLFRANLPAYMVPSYLEYLPVIPMTTSDKADRKALPPPMGARFIAATTYVPPNTETEETLAGAVADIMKLDKVSIEDNFFKDLGAHSLLMAQFGSKLRKIEGFPEVSMRDIYLNPTVEKLAAFVDSAKAQAGTEDVGSYSEPERKPLRIPSNLEYYGCGAAQALFYLAYGTLLLWLFTVGFKWSYAVADQPVLLCGRVVGFSLATFTFFTLLAVAAKWLLIGRWKPEIIPIWSARYFRFWVVKFLVTSAPMTMFAGTPLFNVYLRWLGAKVGKNVVLGARAVPICTDLTTFGDNVVLRKDSVLPGYKAHNNYIYTGSISLGNGAYVGASSFVDINTRMEEEAQLGHASALLEGQCAKANTQYCGAPAQETEAIFKTVLPMPVTALRKWLYSAFLFVSAYGIAAPLSAVFFFALVPTFQWAAGITHIDHTHEIQDVLTVIGRTVPESIVVFATMIIAGLVSILTIPRLLNLFLEEGKTYPLYGFHYFIQGVISRTSNSIIYNHMFGDSVMAVHYLKALGYKLNRIIQTGSNFGMNQKHDDPFLCDIGTGTMVSDGLSMINQQMSSTSFKLAKVKVGENTYMGNNVVIPSTSRVGSNCLLATKVFIPVDGPIRENVGLLGSPSFEIPRVTEQDEAGKLELSEDERKERIRQKTIHNVLTLVGYLISRWAFVFGILTFGYLGILYYPEQGLVALVAAAIVNFFFMVGYASLIEWGSLGFERLKPRYTSVYKSDFWQHERHWKWCEHPLMTMFKGTPLKNWISRLLGVRLGSKAFDDGCSFYEKTLITIGDNANLNFDSVIQGHSLEEGQFKSDSIKIGNGCNIAPLAFVHYGVSMGNDCALGPHAFLMKGEVLDDGTTWQGNPAKAVATSKALEPGADKPVVAAKPRFQVTELNETPRGRAAE